MEFSLNKIYNFSTLMPSVLGTSFKSMKVKGVLTSQEAVKYRDIATLHATVLPMLSGLPKRIEQLSYIIFENIDGEQLLLAYEYIDISSIVEVKTVNIRVDILEANTDDILIIQERLKELGYSKFKIRTFD